MAWAAIGGAVVGVVGNAIVNKGRSGGSPSAAADPFADQRGQYQGQLADLMYKQNPGQGANHDLMQGIAQTGGKSDAFNQLNAMAKPGYDFAAEDPSYKFRLAQGTENLNRGAARSGMLESGNRLAALQDYGQGMASQEYASQFNRLGTLAGINMQQQSNQFQQYNQMDSNAQNNFQNNYARLAQLSGATSGSPGAAGQLLQGQQGNAAAFYQKAGQGLWGAASDWWNSGNGSNASTPNSSEWQGAVNNSSSAPGTDWSPGSLDYSPSPALSLFAGG